MKTLALVIGNDEYGNSAKLINAVKDASGISEVFEKLGFNVITRFNCKAEEYSEILTNYESQIDSYDATIFYFAGHGFEVDGENYLAAIDCQLVNSSKYHYNRTCIRLREILELLEKHPNKINIVIIDACRKSFERGGNIGFSPIQSPRGTLLAFSTSPNEGASDVGFEGHSIYTGALLKYIGREGLYVEELFKKVRKTVFNLSGGKQTTWEHTSLIGDYFFNTGQLVFSKTIPYDEKVVKDVNYEPSGKFGTLIKKVKSYDWNIQNPAIHGLLNIPRGNLNKNELFILGRNLLQVSEAAFKASNFFIQNFSSNIICYEDNGENHVLNGILFEIYFDSRGEFRKDKTKKHHLDKILSLRKDSQFKQSFDFIRELILETQYPLIYIPKEIDEVCDIDINASKGERDHPIKGKETFEEISKVIYNSIDITKHIEKYNVYRKNSDGLKSIIANFLTSPINLVQLNCNIGINSCEIVNHDIEI